MKSSIFSRTNVAQCHLVLHEGYLHVANYLVGCYCIWRVNPRTGAITEKVFEDKHGKGTGKVASRQVCYFKKHLSLISILTKIFKCYLSLTHLKQADAHAHGVYIHNNYSYVPDLGADKIWIYKVCGTMDSEGQGVLVPCRTNSNKGVYNKHTPDRVLRPRA